MQQMERRRGRRKRMDEQIYYGVLNMILQKNDSYNNINYNTTSSDETVGFAAPSSWDPNKPWLVLQIGPSKTGTSTVQKDSAQFTEALAQDNFLFAGNSAPKRNNKATRYLLANSGCLKQVVQQSETQNKKPLQIPCWRELIQILPKRPNNNNSTAPALPMNILTSNEGFSYRNHHFLTDLPYLRALAIAFQDWNFVVVPTYRRYFEWIISVLKELNNKICLRQDRWPHQGGASCVKVWYRIQVMLNRGTKRKNSSKELYSVNYYRNIDLTVKLWNWAGVPTRILNLHDQHHRHLTDLLYCYILPNTPHTCHVSATRTDPSSVHNARSVVKAAASDMVFQAAQRGLWNRTNKLETMTRNQAIDELEQWMMRHNVTFAHLPLLCPTKHILNKLLEKSLTFEALVMPFDYANGPLVRNEHIAAFWKLAHTQRAVCNLDLDRIFHNDAKSWEAVLEGLLTMDPLTNIHYYPE